MSIRRAYAIAAGITWFGLGLGLILTAFNVYPPVNVPPGLLGVIRTVSRVSSGALSTL